MICGALPWPLAACGGPGNGGGGGGSGRGSPGFFLAFFFLPSAPVESKPVSPAPDGGTIARRGDARASVGGR